MTATIRGIGTAVPETHLDQRATRDLVLAQPGMDRLTTRLVGAAFDGSAIDTRGSVLPELAGIRGGASAFVDPESSALLAPSTGERNAIYAREAPELARDAALRALAAADVDPSAITHVITVSCTGFVAPGPDYLLVRELGLAPSTARVHIGFMGCYGAFPALRTAAAFCATRSDAVVLVVCVELCSLHLRVPRDVDEAIAVSVFADGAAAAVVTADEGPGGRTVLDLERFSTGLVPDGESDMAWTIGDTGFEMRLSPTIPRLVGENIAGAVDELLHDRPQLLRDPAQAVMAWAVHPGGRSVLDRVQEALGLSDAALVPSRDVLREHGNMSSATVLFILQRILEHRAGPEPEAVCAMAFGPGITVETALLAKRITG